MSKTEVKVVFGSMTIARAGTSGARVTNLEDASAILDTFQQHGHNEIDTARVYGEGTSEEMLAELKWKDRGLVMATKLWPNPAAYTHKPEDVRRGLQDSLKALSTTSLDLFYLHAPDRTVPFEVTLAEVDKLHREGCFRQFGLSNYASWEVAQIMEICEKRGWIRPTVYQGVYSALQRNAEPELFTCLRHYGISFYAHQPLAGGFLTGKWKPDQKEIDAGSRFDPNTRQGSIYRARYWKDAYFNALDKITAAAKSHNLTETEVALRWLEHHSQLKRQYNDAIIIGASSVKHLEDNLSALEKGPLPEDVVQQLDAAWLLAKTVAPNYYL